MYLRGTVPQFDVLSEHGCDSTPTLKCIQKYINYSVHYLKVFLKLYSVDKCQMDTLVGARYRSACTE